MNEEQREIPALITLPDSAAERDDMHEYQAILSEILARMGHGSTTRAQLDAMGAHLLGERYAGTYSLSEHVPLSRQQPYAIINTDDAPGDHWLAVIQSNGRNVLYDSFGRAELGDQSGDAEQHMAETNCGQRCLAWLLLAERRGVRAARRI